MGYYTFVDNAVPTSSQWNANFRDQVITQCTAATRPGSPVEGQCIYETDTNKMFVYTGAAWGSLINPSNGALITYTPTLTQSGAVTCTVTAATYIRVGRMIIGTVKLDVTGSGTGANNVVVGLPVTARTIANEAIGSGTIRDVSATTWYSGTLVGVTTTTAVIVANGQTNPLGQSSFTAALANTDIVTYEFHYEAAADA